VQRLLDRPEPAQRLEGGQRQQQLGLVERVLERAGRVLPRNAGGLLGGEAGLRLLHRRVGLQGQRLVGGEDLEQERQPGPEALDGGGAEQRLGIARDRLVQRPSVGQHAGLVGMGTHPELGVRPLSRYGVPQEFRDDRPAAP
jgi:hypothetical protein